MHQTFTGYIVSQAAGNVNSHILSTDAVFGTPELDEVTQRVNVGSAAVQSLSCGRLSVTHGRQHARLPLLHFSP